MSDRPEITRDQAAAFLKTLWPEGEQAYLANHTRTFFEAHVGPLSTPLSVDYRDERSTRLLPAMAGILRQIADHFEKEWGNGF